MEKILTLRNGTLEAEIRLPGSEPAKRALRQRVRGEAGDAQRPSLLASPSS